MPARTCLICESNVRVPDGFAGRSFNCPECGEPIVPAGSRRGIARERPTLRKSFRRFAAVLMTFAMGAVMALLIGAGSPRGRDEAAVPRGCIRRSTFPDRRPRSDDGLAGTQRNRWSFQPWILLRAGPSAEWKTANCLRQSEQNRERRRKGGDAHL